MDVALKAFTGNSYRNIFRQIIEYTIFFSAISATLLYFPLKEYAIVISDTDNLWCAVLSGKRRSHQMIKQAPINIETTYILTESEKNDLLNTPDADSVLTKVFSHYPVNCVSMTKLDNQTLDEKMNKLRSCFSPRTRQRLIEDIISVVRAASVGTPEKAPIIDEMIHLMRQDVTADFDVKEFAQKRGISIYYLLHLFKRIVEKTVTEYKNELRISNAKELLISTQKSVAEIAEICGFCSSSYFSEIFKQNVRVTPLQYRKILCETMRDNLVLKKADDRDILLYSMLPHITLASDLDIELLPQSKFIQTIPVIRYQADGFGFLHEAAIIEYHGVLFNAWYNNCRTELMGETPIRFSRSFDGGQTWTDPKTVITDPTGKFIYCPPVFGIQNDRLYMFLNEMVKPDHIHALYLYVYKEETDTFVFVWKKPIPFKLNTNMYELPNGKLLLPGRVGELDQFADIPGVLICDSGKIDGDWRIVKLQETNKLPDGTNYIHPEPSCILHDNKIYMFVRNDLRHIPIVYISEDNSDTWTGPNSHDIPFSNSKIYSGTLQNGWNYIVGNSYPGRGRLFILFAKPNTFTFTKGYVLQDGISTQFGYGAAWHYPGVCESNGKLYVTYTLNLDNSWFKRELVLSVLDINKLLFDESAV